MIPFRVSYGIVPFGPASSRSKRKRRSAAASASRRRSPASSSYARSRPADPAPFSVWSAGAQARRQRLIMLRWVLVALTITVVETGAIALTVGPPYTTSTIFTHTSPILLAQAAVADAVLLAVVVSRTVVDAHSRGFRGVTLLWITVALCSLFLVWPAILFVLYWCIVLVSADRFGDLTAGFPTAFTDLLRLAEPFAAGVCLLMLVLATSATILELRRAQEDRTAQTVRPAPTPRPRKRTREPSIAAAPDRLASPAPDRSRAKERERWNRPKKWEKRDARDELPPRYPPGLRPPES